MRKLLCLIIMTLVLYSLSGCNNGGCTDMRSSTPRADFYSASTQKAILVDSLEVTGIGAPGDSLLYNGSQRLSMIYLPMPADRENVSWRLAYIQAELAAVEAADTLSYTFERFPWFAGEECGAMYKYRITSMHYTTHLIDSVSITDSLVANVDVPTFNIYFRTE